MTTSSAPPAGRRRLKILFVQSQGDRATDVREKLAAAGHVVTEASSGDDAARILRNRPVNLVLVEGGRDALGLLEIAASLRGASGRVSARYTPIFVLADKASWSLPWPTYIDGALSTPLDNEALITAYLEFLSDSLHGTKRGADMTPCCEIDAAIDRLGGDVELYKDLVERFLDDTAGMRQRLEAAIDQQDAAMLHTAAHSLKGLAASVGAMTAAAALAELEALGRRDDLGGVSAAWRQYRIEMERTADELAAHHRRRTIVPVDQR